MMKPCFILQLKIDRDLAILRTGKFPFPEESLISQCSKLIHAEVSINRIDADYRGEWSGISLHEVTNIHPLPADAPIDRRCNVRKFKIQVEPNRVPGSTSSRYGRTLSFPVCFKRCQFEPEVILMAVGWYLRLWRDQTAQRFPYGLRHSSAYKGLGAARRGDCRTLP